MVTWYTEMASFESAEDAARAFAGNWRAFQSFGGYAKPANPEGCAIIYLSNRESDCIDQSNEAAILKALDPALGSLADVAMARACTAMAETCSHSHWAVGHVDGIVIRCADEHGEPSWAFRKLYELACALDTYPILDEEDCSKREQEAADEMWRGCFTDKERIDYIRRKPSTFEFHDLADLMGCVRGRYFAGNPSDLLLT